MKQQYVQAFLALIFEGMPVDTALTGLRDVLEKKHHTKLLAPVLLEVVRILEAKKDASGAVVALAHAADAEALSDKIKATLADMGVSKETAVKQVVDETLIGGFVATFDFKEYDQSYKKALTSLYESITK